VPAMDGVHVVLQYRLHRALRARDDSTHATRWGDGRDDGHGNGEAIEAVRRRAADGGWGWEDSEADGRADNGRHMRHCGQAGGRYYTRRWGGAPTI
jgi:hypothetical protein